MGYLPDHSVKDSVSRRLKSTRADTGHTRNITIIHTPRRYLTLSTVNPNPNPDHS